MFLAAICSLSLCIHNSIIAQTTKTIYSTFEVANLKEVTLGFDLKRVEVITTKSSRMRIEKTVRVPDISLKLLDYLISTGRYDLVENQDQASAKSIIKDKKVNHVLVIKGKECKEEFSYVVYLPDHIQQVNYLSEGAAHISKE